jgi:N4-gp56 family major capsid protein
LELWSDEILDALERNLVLANLVNTDFSGMIQGKGDKINIPMISNLTANTKVANTAVTVQAPDAESCASITIDQHKEVSFLVEDFAEIQTSFVLRNAYTKRAGYAIALALDSALLALGEGAWDIIDATSTGNASVLVEDDILIAKTILDENLTPLEDRHIVIGPQQYNQLLSIDRFTSYEKLGPNGGGTPIQRGLLGAIHGFQVWMSQQLTATGTGTADTCNTLFFHRDALTLAVQLSPRVQVNYIPEYLGFLVTTDIIYGLATLRADWGVIVQNDAITYSLVT